MVFLLLVLALIAPVAWADFRDGVRPFDRC